MQRFVAPDKSFPTQKSETAKSDTFIDATSAQPIDQPATVPHSRLDSNADATDLGETSGSKSLNLAITPPERRLPTVNAENGRTESPLSDEPAPPQAFHNSQADPLQPTLPRGVSSRKPTKLGHAQPNPNSPVCHATPLRLPSPAPQALPVRLPTHRMNRTTPMVPSFSPWLPPSLGAPSNEKSYFESHSSDIRSSPDDMVQASFVETARPSIAGSSYAALDASHPTPTGRESTALIDRAACPSLPWPHADDFSETPLPVDPWFHDGEAEQTVYDDKRPVPTQRPWIEWGRRFYGSGITPPSENWLGDTNLIQQQLYLYGDYRTAISTGRNDVGRIDNWASRLNLDLDYRITATERFHAFFGPLNRANQFTRVELVDGEIEYRDFYNMNPVTAYFEGDGGALLGGATGTASRMELPITAGLVPLVFQNGVWLEDAVSGVAVAIPARHSRLLNWSNFDATFFAVFDQINSPAFGNDNHAAQAVGTAWFIDAYDGYIETGYAYLNDREDLGRSYHNATASFTRRYFDRISNSVRVIINAGQDLPKANRTADGVLLLVENSLVTAEPLTVVPYFNLFAGWDRPQSVARAGVSGGVLRNTGINFEIDGLNGYPTLDSSAADTAGGSIGVDLIGNDLDRQLLLEASYVTPHGERSLINGEQFALGTRYQVAISHRSIIRFDTIYGWNDNDTDIYGTRIEYRWKF